VIQTGKLAVACTCASMLGLVPGCKESVPEEIEPLKVPLAFLESGKRTRVMMGDRAIELMKTPEGVRARSLLCTHQGCNVRWLEDQNIYLCPCHDGKFDADGKPIYGPPREALRGLEVTLTATEVIIGG